MRTKINEIINKISKGIYRHLSNYSFSNYFKIQQPRKEQNNEASICLINPTDNFSSHD